jgi:hypothetical protein
MGADEIFSEITRRKERLAQIDEELAVLKRPAKQNGIDENRLRKMLPEELGAFRELLRSDVQEAREALRVLLAGPIKCLPHVAEDGRRTFAFRGETVLDRVLNSRNAAFHNCGTEERT